MKKLLFSAFTIFATLSAFTQTQLIENFNYGSANDTLTAVNVNNNWIQIGTTTTFPIRANGTGLTFSGYAGSGIGNSASLTTSGQDIYRDFSSVITASNVYCSFVLNVSAAQAAGDYFLALLPNSSTTNYAARTFAKASGAGYVLGISKGTETVIYSSTVLSFNTSYVVVVKYIYNSGGSTDDQCGLYIFPSTIPATEPSSFDAGITIGVATDMPNVARVALRQGSAGNSATLTIDGIRASATWANGPLPVKLTSFTAEAVNQNVILNWATAAELNNNGFEIEKSLDGKHFEKIAFVKGNGTSARVNKYQFIDAVATKQIDAYYRLKQVDFDGKFTYSDIVKVSNDNQLDVVVGPNPFSNEIKVTSNQNIYAIEVIDMTGKVCFSSNPNSLNYSFKLDNMNNGVYFIRVNNGEQTISKRIIKN